jgi:protein-disulfide isomerase
VTVAASAGNASQQEVFLVSEDGRKIIRGTVYDVAEDPFAADAGKIDLSNQPSFGPADAPVSVVIFSDFQCSYCREEAKVVRNELAKAYPAQVRVVFKDFPLDPIHPWARPAAIAGRCIYRQKPAGFWEYHDWVFEKQPEITTENFKDKVQEFAKGKDIDAAQLGACMDSKATEAEVNRSQAEARAIGVNSTPTIFVNGRRLVGNLPWPNLKQVLDHEVEYAAKHAKHEKCCQVNLSAPPAK